MDAEVASRHAIRYYARALLLEHGVDLPDIRRYSQRIPELFEFQGWTQMASQSILAVTELVCKALMVSDYQIINFEVLQKDPLC